MASSSAQGTPDLKTVCNELEEVKHKAHEIGIQLGIQSNKLLQFKLEGNLTTTIVNYWLKGNVPETPTTWSSIIAALESNQVGEKGLAEAMRRKYCPDPEAESNKDCEDAPASLNSSPPSSDVELDLQQQLNRSLEEIKMKFTDYVDRIQTIVLGKKIDVKELISYLLKLPLFNKSDSTRKPQLLSDLKDELKKAEDVIDVFDLLVTDYASFLDYSIFKRILEKYGTDEEKKELNYPDHLKVYMEKHKVNEFVKLNPTLINPKLRKLVDSSKVISVKLIIEKTRSLSTLNEIKIAVADILDIKASALRLCGIKKGCVLMDFLIPLSVAEILFTHHTEFVPEQIHKFREASVFWLECNGFKFDFSEGNNSQHLDAFNSTTKFSQTEKLLLQTMDSEMNIEEVVKVIKDTDMQEKNLKIETKLILVVKTEMGKSTLVHGLVGREVAEAHPGLATSYDTSKVQSPYKQKSYELSVAVYSSLEFIEGTGSTTEKEGMLFSKHNEVDLVIFGILNPFVPGNHDERAILNFTGRFGTKVWKKTVIVTYHMAKPLEQMETYTKRVRQLLKKAKVPAEIALGMAIIPGYETEPPKCLDESLWFSTFWLACWFTISSKEVRAYLLKVNKSRFQSRESVKDSDFEKPLSEQPIVLPDTMLDKIKQVQKGEQYSQLWQQGQRWEPWGPQWGKGNYEFAFLCKEDCKFLQQANESRLPLKKLVTNSCFVIPLSEQPTDILLDKIKDGQKGILGSQLWQQRKRWEPWGRQGLS